MVSSVPRISVQNIVTTEGIDAAVLSKGTRVKIDGIQAEKGRELNGEMGVLQGDYNAETKRWTVKMDSTGEGKGVK